MRQSQNEHGVAVSHHRCDVCGDAFTVTPAVDDATWGGSCLASTCSSYDINRDAERFFLPDDPALIEGRP